MKHPRPVIHGFSLIELTLSLGICSLLLAGMGSVIMLSAKAIPNANSPASRVSASTRGADLLCTELYYAQSFSNLSPTSITFTVAPRGSDTGPETITYSWSGVAGDPLVRQYNGNRPAPVVLNVSKFALAYNRIQRQSLQTSYSTTTTPEQLLTSWTSWPGVSNATYNDFAASSQNQISEYFAVPNSGSAWPTGAVLNVTRVRLLLESVSGGGASYTVGLYKPSTTSGPDPSTVAISSPVTFSAATLSSPYVWTDIPFPGAKVADPSQNGMCVVVSAPTIASSVNVQYMASAQAPTDTPVMQTSSDSGSTWGPSGAAANQQDVEFECYGTFTTTTATQQTITDSYLPSVTFQLQTGTDGTAPLVTTAEVYSQPKVTGL